MDDRGHHIGQKFNERFGVKPLLVRAPGRINLIGEHTDYNDGFVMPAAIDREIIFAFAPSTDGRTIIYADDFDEAVEIDLHAIRRDDRGGWINYLLGVIDRFRARHIEVAPFRCLFGGNIPVGSGLSSSAALECGFAYGLRELNDAKLSDEDLIRIAQWSEHNYAGVKCGIMDQFACIMGKKDQVLMLDCRDLSYRYLPFAPRDFKVVLFDSNVKHALASSEYNTRRSECEEGLRILRQENPDIRSLRDVTQTDVEARKEIFPDSVLKRLLYVTGEITRVQAAARDLERNDLLSFGAKMSETHRGLSELYEVSCAELDFLVNQLASNGTAVAGARMMGGGFGGCVIALVRPSAINVIAEPLADAYRKAFGLELAVYEVNLVDGTGRVEALKSETA
jgi:galactokinase